MYSQRVGERHTLLASAGEAELPSKRIHCSNLYGLAMKGVSRSPSVLRFCLLKDAVNPSMGSACLLPADSLSKTNPPHASELKSQLGSTLQGIAILNPRRQ